MSKPTGRTREQVLIEILRYFASVSSATRSQAATAVGVNTGTHQRIWSELQYAGKLQGKFKWKAQWSITPKGLAELEKAKEPSGESN